ncbi:hypothetical protein PanWU01x14_108490 [Parasponia andersonii]|uniref:Uncharacterized protein n=1 Tax=Parasponia andersonii TaxID=3476 RepID=A0A2P5D024_PARAD|nr:hypothetical protein PanWU01x14_108490 [Parasponia andersonii]
MEQEDKICQSTKPQSEDIRSRGGKTTHNPSKAINIGQRSFRVGTTTKVAHYMLPNNAPKEKQFLGKRV